MSAVNSTTFANKKPNLTGNVTPLDGVNQLSYPTVTGSGGTAVIDNFAETIYTSVSLTATEASNKGFFRKTAALDTPSGTSATFRVREDDINGAILTSTSIGASFSGSVSMSVTITDQPIGARTYVYTIQLTGSPGDFYRFHGNASTSVSPNTTVAYIVDIDDTHNTKNPNIIRG